MIVPLPQHPDSIDKRGHNHAEELSKIIGEHINVSCDNEILRKTKDITMRGKGLNERQESVKGLYAPSVKQLNDETILLIDDLYTTGCNVNECSKILKNIGARVVYVLVAGRDAPEY